MDLSSEDLTMPPTKEANSKYSAYQSYSSGGMSLSARVYHQATNLLPLTPPHSPTTPFNSKPPPTWSRQNSYNNGKQS